MSIADMAKKALGAGAKGARKNPLSSALDAEDDEAPESTLGEASEDQRLAARALKSALAGSDESRVVRAFRAMCKACDGTEEDY